MDAVVSLIATVTERTVNSTNVKVEWFTNTVGSQNILNMSIPNEETRKSARDRFFFQADRPTHRKHSLPPCFEFRSVGEFFFFFFFFFLWFRSV